MSRATLASVTPNLAIEGGRVSLHGHAFPTDGPRLPEVFIGDQSARVVFASPRRIDVIVPKQESPSDIATVRLTDVDDIVALQVAPAVATGLHQVDSPAIDADGNLFLTYSGTRDQRVPVSIFRVTPSGTRETYSAAIQNPTSMAIGPGGQLFVSSRFEGTVYRVAPDGRAETFATELGVPCGLVFGPDGTLFVGDRSGTIFAVDSQGRATPFATLPPSMAAFHLALGKDGLYVAAPTLSSRDFIYRVTLDGIVSEFSRMFGRPQGLAFGPDGDLFVIDALAASGGLFRLSLDGTPSHVLAGQGLIGVAFDPLGRPVICTADTAYRTARAA